MPRCENCGKENPAPLCASCAHYRKKQEQAATAQRRTVATPKPPDRPDPAELRERFRRVEETLLDGGPTAD